MDEEHSACQVSWGARVNTRERQDASDCPDWANPAERDRWVQQGLIIWQEETQHIIRLSATYVLQGLDQFRSNTALTELDVIVGEPVTRIPLKGPEPKPELVLHNPIQLSPRQTKALLRLLERNEKRLTAISEEEIKKGSRALGKAYRLILEYTAS